MPVTGRRIAAAIRDHVPFERCVELVQELGQQPHELRYIGHMLDAHFVAFAARGDAGLLQACLGHVQQLLGACMEMRQLAATIHRSLHMQPEDEVPAYSLLQVQL